MQCTVFKQYLFPLILLLSIITGGLTGHYWPSGVHYLQPIGDIFLNLLLSVIVPLVFFSISATLATIQTSQKIIKIFMTMLLIFVSMSLVAAGLMIVIVKCWPPASTIFLPLATPIANIHALDKVATLFSVRHFSDLLSHEHLLALIVFAVLVGLATRSMAEESWAFSRFLTAGASVFFKVITLLMKAAPIGFFAYFSVLVANLGPQLLTSYAQVTLVYYLSGGAYFMLISSLYAYLAGGSRAFKNLWPAMMLPAATSLATCSSAASIPANLIAAKKLNVAPVIYETLIPLGGLLHKDGTVLGAIVKIAFLFGVFHLPFSGWDVYLTAMLVALLVGTVMGAIPSGGMLGEMVILALYGFPSSALMLIAAISIIIDPLATMLNVTGNTLASLLVARLIQGKRWLIHGDKEN